MWPFSRKKSSKPTLPKFIYTSGEAFFEMQCKFGYTEITEQKGIVGIVLDAKLVYGTEVSVKIQPNGCQVATIKLASSDGGFVTFAETASSGGDRLEPGDLIVWLPMIRSQKFADALGDDRRGWIGLIIAKIAAESDPNTNELSVICRY